MIQPYSKASFNNAATLQVSDLACVRGHRALFSGLNFDVHSGSAVHIVGENGVGKTCLLRILAGLGQSEQGVVRWNGSDITEHPSGYYSAMTYLGHKIGLQEKLTVRENLIFLDHLGASACAVTATESLKIMDMDGYVNSPVFQLSAGQRQRVGLVRVLRSHAQLWLLDEPATALDNAGTALLEYAMGVHINAGGIIIYTSHQNLAHGDKNYQQIDLT